MIYATVYYENREQLCCIDGVGGRAFPLEEFFRREGGPECAPASMIQFIRVYQPEWTDKTALFFGQNPELAVPLESLKLLAPIPAPARNIICLGKNYRAHIEEMKGQIFSDDIPPYPIYFTKPDHTVVGTGQTVLAHSGVTSRLDYEAELAVVIGKKGINIPKEDAEDYIFGYTVANDVSARELQRSHGQWHKGKSLTTHCPMGPWIVHKSVLPFPIILEVTCHINGELRQRGNTRDLIFDIPTIISDLSRGYELRPGDVILTGTPSGVGMALDPPQYLKIGDQMVCQVEKIGTLVNTVGE